jgi:hypothetical protein
MPKWRWHATAQQQKGEQSIVPVPKHLFEEVKGRLKLVRSVSEG